MQGISVFNQQRRQSCSIASDQMLYGFVFLEQCFKIPVEKMNIKNTSRRRPCSESLRVFLCDRLMLMLFPIHAPRDLVISNQTPSRPQMSNKKATTKSKEKLHQSSHLGNIQRSRNPAKHTHATKKENRPAVMLPWKLESFANRENKWFYWSKRSK